MSISVLSLHAQTADELNSKISQTNSDLASLEQEIAQYQDQLTSLAGQKDSLTKTVSELSISAKKLALDIKVTEGKITDQDLQIDKLSSSIADKADTIKTDDQAVGSLLRTVAENDHTPLIVQILEQDEKLSTVWRDIDEIQTVHHSILASVSDLKNSKKELEDNKANVESAKAVLAGLEADLSNQKKVIDQNTAVKNKLLKDTKNQESNYAKLLKEKLAKRDAFDADLRSYESTLQFVLNPSALPDGHVLSWPVDDVKITQLFGRTVAAKRLYVSGSHNGVDFGVPIGTPVHAVLAGKVIGSGNTDLTCPGASYGNWILVQHDNGLTSVYGHLSLVTAKVGDIVQTGQTIAYSGMTGYATGPHVHLTIFVSSAVKVTQMPSKACVGKIYTQPIAPISAFLDPMLYLPPIEPSMKYY